MKLLHIYGQPSQHFEAKIIGNTEGLLALKESIEKALRNGRDMTPADKDCLFASDGEGYSVIIERHDSPWGQDKDGTYNSKRFWNKLQPQYTEFLFKEL